MMQTITMADGVTVQIPESAQLVNPQSVTSEHVGSMTVLVDGVATDRAVIIAGQSATVRVECSIPLNDSFAVPIAGLFGAHGRTLQFEFIDGVAERVVSFPVSGEWVCTEDQINANLPPGQQWQFVGIKFSVTE